MNQKVSQQIQHLERKYMLGKRLSTISTNKDSQRLRTLPETPNANLTQNQQPLSKSRLTSSDFNYRQKPKSLYSQREVQTEIGKKYFDLSIYKAESSLREFGNSKNLSFNLPKLTSNFQTDLYSETASERGPNLGDQSSIWKRAMEKVELIYEREEKLVDEKHQKIMKIKNRLKLLDRISKDKLRLQNRMLSMREE